MLAAYVTGGRDSIAQPVPARSQAPAERGDFWVKNIRGPDLSTRQLRFNQIWC